MTLDLAKIDDGIDSRSYLNVSKALTLRIQNKLSYGEIGEKFGVSRQAVHQALKPFIALISNPEAIEAYRDNRALLFDAGEMVLLSDIVDTEKRKKATLGNVAYALDKLNQLQRLERGQSTSNVSYLVMTMDLGALEKERQKLRDDLGIIEAEYTEDTSSLEDK